MKPTLNLQYRRTGATMKKSLLIIVMINTIIGLASCMEKNSNPTNAELKAANEECKKSNRASSSECKEHVRLLNRRVDALQAETERCLDQIKPEPACEWITKSGSNTIPERFAIPLVK
jgi:hypothetical protein